MPAIWYVGFDSGAANCRQGVAHGLLLAIGLLIAAFRESLTGMGAELWQLNNRWRPLRVERLEAKLTTGTQPTGMDWQYVVVTSRAGASGFW